MHDLEIADKEGRAFTVVMYFASWGNSSHQASFPNLGNSRASPVKRAMIAILATVIAVVAGMSLGECYAADSTGLETGKNPALLAGSGETYAIGPGDELIIDVRDNQESSKIVRVRPDGYISIPLAEDIRAADKTPAELAAAIRERLSDFLIDPVVTVVVAEAVGSIGQQVRIIGAGAEPRAVPYTAGMRALDVLMAVGGLKRVADGNGAVLVRDSSGSPRKIPLQLRDLIDNGDATANIAIAPGDIIVIPEGFVAGDWRRDLWLTSTSSYTDNYRLDPAGERDPAWITSLSPTMSISGKGARVEGALSASLTGQYVALSHTGPNVRPNVLGTSTTELSRDTAYVDAAALVSEMQLNAFAPTSSTAGNDTNRTLVQAYQLSPYAVSRVKDWGYLETRYTLAGVVTGGNGNSNRDDEFLGNSDQLSDSFSNTMQISLHSPPEQQSRLQWQGVTYGNKTTRLGASDITAASLAATPEYSLTNRFSLLTTAGYGILDDGSERLSGPDIAAGFRYEPSPALSFRALGGWRLENPQADVLLQYKPGPKTTLTAHYTDSVAVGQSTLVQSLSDVTFDPKTHQFVNRQTTLPYSGYLQGPELGIGTPQAYVPFLTGFNLNNGLSRSQQGEITLTRTLSKNEFQLSSFVIKQEAIHTSSEDSDAELNDQLSWGINCAWKMPLNNKMAMTSSVSFLSSDRSGGETDTSSNLTTGSFEEMRFHVGMTRKMTETVSGFLGYYLQRRFATEGRDEFIQNAFVTGLIRRF